MKKTPKTQPKQPTTIPLPASVISRRALFPRIATITAAISALGNPPAADAAAPATTEAPRHILPLAPINYGAATEYQEAFAIALSRVEPVLRELGPLAGDHDNCDLFYRAISAIAGPLGYDKAEQDADEGERWVQAQTADWARTDRALSARRWEYLLFSEAAYLLGLAAGLHLTEQQRGGAR